LGDAAKLKRGESAKGERTERWREKVAREEGVDVVVVVVEQPWRRAMDQENQQAQTLTRQATLASAVAASHNRERGDQPLPGKKGGARPARRRRTPGWQRVKVSNHEVPILAAAKQGAQKQAVDALAEVPKPECET